MTSFTQKTWYDNAAGGTPIQAADLNRHESALATMATIPTPDMMCHAIWGNTGTDFTVVGNGMTDILNDTVVYDPYKMRNADGASFNTPWAGRYSFYTRVTFTQNDTIGYSLCWYNATTGAAMAWQGTPTVFAATPVSIYTEEILPAGWNFKPQVFRSSTGNQWVYHLIPGSATRTQSIIRYLGPN